MIKKYNEIQKILKDVKEDILEMARLKSDFDIDKFTISREGSFIAHRFHFLMRQYSLALYEAKRLILDKEEKERQIKDIEKNGVDSGKYSDIEIERAKNEIDLIEISLRNKIAMIDRFEIARQKLIERNGRKFTDKQYQDEEPEYWAWFLRQKAKEQLSERQTGIKEGVWENIRYLEEVPTLDISNQVKMLNEEGKLNLDIDNRKLEKA